MSATRNKNSGHIDYELEDLENAQRIDKWLWCARFFKTRGLAAKFVSSGKLRLRRNASKLRISKPGFLVRPGDQLTYGRDGRVICFEILSCAIRRGPAKEAQTLYRSLPSNEATKAFPG